MHMFNTKKRMSFSASIYSIKLDIQHKHARKACICKLSKASSVFKKIIMLFSLVTKAAQEQQQQQQQVDKTCAMSFLMYCIHLFI